MRVFLRYLILVIAGIAPLLAYGQQQGERKGPRIGSSVLDDSTRNVYGPKTTKWSNEEDIFFNRNNYQTIDTSVLDYHRWTYVARFNNRYKDLGNMGTSLVSIFPELRPDIGVSSGFTTYEQYFLQNQPRYYDTKSPYARMYLVWGGFGRAATAAEFSRNINSRWNFGFSYKPILVDKQVQRSRKGDRHVISQYYDAYTSYRTKDEKYSAYFTFQRMKHRVKENGGISVEESQSLTRKMFDTNAPTLLDSAETMELRIKVHLYHQYKIGKGLQLYHIFDRTKQRNGIHDTKVDSSYFDFQEYKKGTVFDRTQIKTVQNEVGVKGNLSRLFYDFYYKIRKYDLQNNRLQNNYSDATQQYDSGVVYSGYEHYVGGRMSLELDSVTRLTGWAEYMLDGNYRIEGKLNTPWLDASLKNQQAKPAFIQNYYRGAHDLWKNFYSNTNSLQATGFLKGKFGTLFISPGFTYTLLTNYIFLKKDDETPQYQQSVKYIQSSGVQQVVSPEVKMEISYWKIFLRPNVIYTRLLQNADGALSIPELFVNTQLSYEGYLFKKNLFAQIGVDYHWQSAYYALGYDPAIQQFYRQDTEIMAAYPLVDVFFNGRIKTGKFFLRYHNLVQLFRKDGQGYIITPGYPGMRSILDFGFELRIFD